METQELLKYILPREIADNFDIVGTREAGNMLTIYLDEKHVVPEEHKDKPLESKGFSPSVTIEDFPIRERKVLLEVRRRLWRDKDTGKIYSRDWELRAQGTSYTREFGAFLKEMVGQLPGKRQ